jgi:hypothetical protein
MRFSEFLSESKASDLGRFLDDAKFSRVVKNHAEGIAKVADALSKKEIYGPEFTDAKRVVSHGFETAYDHLMYKVYFEELRKDDFRERPDTLFAMRSAKKLRREWSPLAGKYPLVIQLLDMAVAAHDDLEKLKDHVIKGRRPAPVDPSRFVKPMASSAAIKAVRDILDPIAESVRKRYEDQVLASLESGLAALEKMEIRTQADMLKIKNPNHHYLATRVFKRAGREYVLREDRDEVVKKMARDRVDQILAHFVSKGTSKLALIFQRKEKLASHRVVSNEVRNGILENDLYFEFTDGSRFRIYSKVEGAVSPKGNLFIRFPSRFGDVVLSSGERMKGPSEEKMIKEF